MKIRRKWKICLSASSYVLLAGSVFLVSLACQKTTTTKNIKIPKLPPINQMLFSRDSNNNLAVNFSNINKTKNFDIHYSGGSHNFPSKKTYSNLASFVNSLGTNGLQNGEYVWIEIVAKTNYQFEKITKQTLGWTWEYKGRKLVFKKEVKGLFNLSHHKNLFKIDQAISSMSTLTIVNKKNRINSEITKKEVFASLAQTLQTINPKFTSNFLTILGFGMDKIQLDSTVATKLKVTIGKFLQTSKKAITILGFGTRVDKTNYLHNKIDATIAKLITLPITNIAVLLNADLSKNDVYNFVKQAIKNQDNQISDQDLTFVDFTKAKIAFTNDEEGKLRVTITKFNGGNKQITIANFASNLVQKQTRLKIDAAISKITNLKITSKGLLATIEAAIPSQILNLIQENIRIFDPSILKSDLDTILSTSMIKFDLTKPTQLKIKITKFDGTIKEIIIVGFVTSKLQKDFRLRVDAIIARLTTLTIENQKKYQLSTQVTRETILESLKKSILLKDSHIDDLTLANLTINQIRLEPQSKSRLLVEITSFGGVKKSLILDGFVASLSQLNIYQKVNQAIERLRDNSLEITLKDKKLNSLVTKKDVLDALKIKLRQALVPSKEIVDFLETLSEDIISLDKTTKGELKVSITKFQTTISKKTFKITGFALLGEEGYYIEFDNGRKIFKFKNRLEIRNNEYLTISLQKRFPKSLSNDEKSLEISSWGSNYGSDHKSKDKFAIKKIYLGLKITSFTLKNWYLTRIMDVSNIRHLTYLDLRNNYFGEGRTNFLVLTNLKELVLDQNGINSRSELDDIWNLVSLTHLSLRNNRISETNFSNLVNLQRLDLNDNWIRSLDVSSLVNLQRLDLSDNLMNSSLDVSNLVNLQWLDLSQNRITSLDVSNLVNLRTLNLLWVDYLEWIDITNLNELRVFELSLYSFNRRNKARIKADVKKLETRNKRKIIFFYL